MIKRIICLLVFGLFVINILPAADFAKDKVIAKIDKHAVAVAVYYAMTEQEYKKRLVDSKSWKEKYPTCQVAFLGKPGDAIRYVAYIGSGTVVKANHVLTVSHLVDQDANTLGMSIYVFRKGYERFWEADLIAKTHNVTSAKDYAVIKTRGDMGLPGIKIAKIETKVGDKVIYVGSTQGLAFNRRFGYISTQKYFFYRGVESALHLGHWEDFEYLMVVDGGPGDSGGGIYNTKGELVSIMYCGVNANHSPVFANPLEMLWEFLRTVELGWIAE